MPDKSAGVLSAYDYRSQQAMRDLDVKPNTNKPEKSAPGEVQSQGSLAVRTNIFKIRVVEQKEIYKYHIKIQGAGTRVDKNGEEVVYTVEFSEGDAAEFFMIERRKVCARLFDAFVERNQDVFPSRENLYYNCRSQFYSTEKIEFQETTFRYDTVDIFGEEGIADPIITSMIRGVSSFAFIFTPSSEISFNNDLAEDIIDDQFDENSFELLQFLDISTSQGLVLQKIDPSHPEALVAPLRFINYPKGVTYFAENPPHFNLDQSPRFPGGVYIASGMRKSAKCIGCADSSISITISPKFSFFFPYDALKDAFAGLIENKNNWSVIDQMIRHSYIFPIHLSQNSENQRLRVHRVVGLHRDQNRTFVPASRVTFDKGSDQISLVDYFFEVYNIMINPNNPVVVCNEGGSKIFYPFELCGFLDDQRLRGDQMVGDMIAQLIRYAAVLPDRLEMLTKSCFDAINLTQSAFLRNAGITIDSKPIEMSVPVLPTPVMRYANSLSKFDSNRGQWPTRGMFYASPAPTEGLKIACYSQASRQFSEDDLRTFIEEYVKMCGQKGLRMPYPDDSSWACVDNLANYFEDLMNHISSNGCNFLLIVTDKADKKIHGSLKAFEQQYGIITQNVTIGVARDTIGLNKERRKKLLSMENIVNKTNVKLGGLVYHLFGGANNSKAIGEHDLIVGFALNQAGGGLGGDLGSLSTLKKKGNKASSTPAEKLEFELKRTAGSPTVLGFAANDRSEDQPLGFAGDYLYHPFLQKGDVDAFANAMRVICERYKVNRQKVPRSVIVYRDGCADGNFRNVYEFEIPVLQKIIDDVFELPIGLSVIVCTKAHSVNFWPADIRGGNASQQNLPYGTLIDREVIGQTFDEFFLVGHRALQGTTKVPRYTVLTNGTGMNLAEIKKMTFDLGFGFQIINSPVSLPSPVKIALEYAKRGRNLFTADVNRDRVRGLRNREDGFDFAQLNDALNYDGQSIRHNRINA